MDLPERQSAFLWGPRKTGKSTYLKQMFPNSLVYDFLKTDLMLDFNRRPALLREQLLAQSAARLASPIILDEVQHVPLLLDEVHWLIENKGLRFILCGSSVRKLKRGRANLLGGRAWCYEMFPLVTDELNDGDRDLLRILNRGLIPDHFASTQYRRSLGAYLQDYLKEEVFAEGLTRDIPAFSRFFEAMGYSHGKLTNFSNSTIRFSSIRFWAAWSPPSSDGKAAKLFRAHPSFTYLMWASPELLRSDICRPRKAQFLARRLSILFFTN